ncbi:MAG: peptidylprolyl isomerase [Mariprofundaceae bacterium]
MWGKKRLSASARHILVESQEECESLKTEIENGADFADVAKNKSSCPSAEKGGDLGEFREGQMVKEFNDIVFSEALNTVHGPVQTQFGYHLIEITDRSDVT